MDKKFGLIADIGGTNARFALTPIHLDAKVSESEFIAQKTLDGSKYATIRDAIEDYLSGLPSDIVRPNTGVIAIACPTDEDQIKMTNNAWSFSQFELANELDFIRLDFINDFFAVANAVPYLPHDSLLAIGDGEPIVNMPQVVTGPGTGLGMAGIVYDRFGHPVTVQGEGGHIHFGPVNDLERQILDYLSSKFERVSVERLVSGQGLENIYEAISFLKSGKAHNMPAAMISKNALSGEDPICVESLSCFCAIFGSFCGDAALMYGAKGGVYLGGGILPKMIPFFQSSQFRSRFVEKARLSGFVQEVPTYLILSKQPGLLGAAAYLVR